MFFATTNCIREQPLFRPSVTLLSALFLQSLRLHQGVLVATVHPQGLGDPSPLPQAASKHSHSLLFSLLQRGECQTVPFGLTTSVPPEVVCCPLQCSVTISKFQRTSSLTLALSSQGNPAQEQGVRVLNGQTPSLPPPHTHTPNRMHWPNRCLKTREIMDQKMTDREMIASVAPVR